MLSERVLARWLAFSGFYENHYPRPSPSGDAHSIVPPHRNGQQSGFILQVILLIVAQVAAAAILSE
jgi:hypothetical protein